MGTTDEGFERELSALDTLGAQGGVLAQAQAVIRAAEMIEVIGRAQGTDNQPQVARLRLLRATLLPALDQGEAAVDELTSVVTDHASDALVAQALLARALLVHERGDDVAAEADVSRLISDFSESDDTGVRRLVVDAHLARLEWAVAAAESDGDTDAEASWTPVVRAAGVLVAQVDRGDHEFDLPVARALSSAASAWRSIAVADEGSGDVSEADAEAMRAAEEIFTRFARTGSEEIRALLARSETALEELAPLLDPAEALRIAERDLELRAVWGARPADFFAGAGLRRARALADLEREQEAHDQLRTLVDGARDTDDAQVQLIVASASEDLVRLLSDTDHGDAAIHEADRLASWLDQQPAIARLVSTRHILARTLGIKIAILASRIDAEEIETLSIDGSPVDSTAQGRESVPLTPPEGVYADAVVDFAGRFAGDEDAGLRLAAAKSLQTLAGHQRLRGHFDQAVGTYRELIRQFGDETSSGIRDTVLGPSELNLGFLLLSLLARPADAIAVYDVAIARIGEPQSSAARSLLGRLQSSRSTALTDLYDRDAVNHGGVRGEEHDGDRGDPIGAAERERIRAAITRGREASSAGDHVSAIAEYDSIIDAHPAPEDRESRQRVCDAMVRKGYSLGELNRWAASVELHQGMLAMFGTDIDATIEKDIALALANLANAFDHLDRHEEEIDAYEQILTRWSDSPIPELVGRCARAAWTKGVTEADLGRSDDAERSYRRGMRYLWAEETATRVSACKSAVNLSIFLRKRSRNEEAASAAQQVIAALGDASGAPAAEQRTKGYMALARADAARGSVQAALSGYEWLLNDHASSITDEQRRTLTQEHIQLLGGPFKAAWRRIRRNHAGR